MFSVERSGVPVRVYLYRAPRLSLQVFTCSARAVTTSADVTCDVWSEAVLCTRTRGLPKLYGLNQSDPDRIITKWVGLDPGQPRWQYQVGDQR